MPSDPAGFGRAFLMCYGKWVIWCVAAVVCTTVASFFGHDLGRNNLILALVLILLASVGVYAVIRGRRRRRDSVEATPADRGGDRVTEVAGDQYDGTRGQ